MVVALAGRRVDPPNAETRRFPASNVVQVRENIERMLRETSAGALVCSAACGADLLALEAAGIAGLPRRIVLPFPARIFRETSVIDRPGDWGERFDRVMHDVEDVVVLSFERGDDAAYAAANHAIFDEALKLAKERQTGAMASVVWNGESRGKGDLTASFLDEARERGLRIVEIATL